MEGSHRSISQQSLPWSTYENLRLFDAVWWAQILRRLNSIYSAQLYTKATLTKGNRMRLRNILKTVGHNVTMEHEHACASCKLRILSVKHTLPSVDLRTFRFCFYHPSRLCTWKICLALHHWNGKLWKFNRFAEFTTKRKNNSAR